MLKLKFREIPSYILNKPQRIALLIIDMQNDFCACGGYYDRKKEKGATDLVVPSCKQSYCSRSMIQSPSNIVCNIKVLIHKARANGMKIMYLKAIYGQGYDNRPMVKRREKRNAHPCKRNTWGAKIIKPIKKEMKEYSENEFVIEKHRYDGFIGTDLDIILRSNNIRSLIITGVETNVCVDSTARTAHNLGYYTIIPRDCVASSNSCLHEYALQNFDQAFGYVTCLNSLLPLIGN